jgi:hypothetical protein
MTLRRLVLLVAAAALVLNRRRVKAALIRATGTNVHTSRASAPADDRS